MILGVVRQIDDRRPFPRMSGDDPMNAAEKFLEMALSPHERG